MATIRTAIQVTDGMSPAFRSMNKAMNIVLNSFEALQTASHHAIDTNSIQAARQELASVEMSLNDVEREIREAHAQQRQFNETLHKGQSAAGGLFGKMTQIAAAVGAYVGLTKTLTFADELTSTKARLDLMNDGLQTSAELQNMIYASAQRSGASYIDTAQTVAKLGILAKDAFSGNKETVAFTEQLNKQFKIGGASIQEQTAAMYQLTQAMSAGRLQGDEFRSIMENAPMLAQAIAEYAGKPIGKLREMSSEGLLTADVIKNAMFRSTDETNKKFAELPMTFGQVWTSIKNKAIKAFDPVLTKISEIVNHEGFEKLTNNLVGGIVIVASAAAGLFKILTSISGVISDNWSWLEPMVWGLVAAFMAYNAVSFLTNTILAVQGLTAKVAAAGQMMQAGATFTATAAQYGLNAALYACPLTWILILIIALIVLFYAAVAAMNHFAGTSVRATGIIAGAFMVALAFIGNLFIGLWNRTVDTMAAIWNGIASVAEFLANVFNDPIGSVVRRFAGMADTVLRMLEGIASALDAIFGSNLAGVVSSWRSGLQGAVDDLVGEAKIKVERMDSHALKLDRFEYGMAWNTGYKAGENFEKNFSLGNILNHAANSLDAFKSDNHFEGIHKGIGDTAGNTAKMANSMESSEEDLKYLRDLAEKEAINRFTTAEIKVKMTNHNNISSEMDLDGVIDYLDEGIYEAMEVAAEGV